MKYATIPFLFPLLIASSSLAPAIAGGRRCLAASQPSVETRVDESIQEAVDLAASGFSVASKLTQVQSVVDEESLTYVSAQGECLIQQRLADEIAEMRARAARYMVHAFEVEALQREIIFARLERAMIELRGRWATRDPGDDVLQKVFETLQINAWKYLESRGPITVRQRLQDAIFAAQAVADDDSLVLAKQLDFIRILYQARLDSANWILKKHLAAGVASKRDYARVQAAMRALARVKQQLLPYDCD